MDGKELDVEKTLVSIIIPIYNVKEYLNRCIDSVIAQTYLNLEIWLIDDGSTDGCGVICDEYAKKDERIHVIHKENGGLSNARNIALEKMTGEYVMFVDSDDFIHENMVSRLFEIVQKEKPDIVSCQIIEGKSEIFPELSIRKKEENVSLKGDNVFMSIFSDHSRHIMIPVWGKLYLSSLFANIRFPIGRIHEDEFVMHHILDKCEKLIIISECLYYHYMREGSISQSPYSLRSLDAIDAIEDRNVFFEKKCNNELLFLCYRDYLRRVQYHYYSLKKYFPNEKEKIGYIENRYQQIYKIIYMEMNSLERLRYGLFLYFPRLNRIIKNMTGARKI